MKTGWIQSLDPKIVYSQACWLLALTDFTVLLLKVGRRCSKINEINHGNNSSRRPKDKEELGSPEGII